MEQISDELIERIINKMFRSGIVSSTEPANCSARVAFEDMTSSDGSVYVSHDLIVLTQGALQTKQYWVPVPGERVLCLCPPSKKSNQGYILGSHYTKTNPPPAADENIRLIRFSDGTVLEYNSSTHTLTVNAVEKISITAPKGVSISATDPAGSGVSITGKNNSESW